MSDHKHLYVEKRGDAVIVQFLDSKIVAELAISTLGDELYAVAKRPDCQMLVLNFSAVEFLSSAMLGKLVALNRMMADKGGVLRLCEICPNIEIIFRHTNLDRILDIRDTEADAEAAGGCPHAKATATTGTM